MYLLIFGIVIMFFFHIFLMFNESITQFLITKIIYKIKLLKIIFLYIKKLFVEFNVFLP